MTGTGGPVLLVPTLLLLGAGVGTALGAVLATRVHADRLRTVVGGACLVAGVLTLTRLVA